MPRRRTMASSAARTFAMPGNRAFRPRSRETGAAQRPRPGSTVDAQESACVWEQPKSGRLLFCRRANLVIALATKEAPARWPAGECSATIARAARGVADRSAMRSGDGRDPCIGVLQQTRSGDPALLDSAGSGRQSGRSLPPPRQIRSAIALATQDSPAGSGADERCATKPVARPA